MKFKALRTFTCREFEGTNYVAGLNYTIRAKSEAKLKEKGHVLLADMAKKWMKAQLFTMKEDVELFGITFKKGSVSYHLEDSFAEIVNEWVDSGKAEYTEGSLITFDVEASSTIVGG